MNYQIKGKQRWIFKFKYLCKQRILIFRIFTLFTFLFLIALIAVCSLSIKNIYYVFPSLIIPASVIYPHAINKKRLENLYVDLPREIKPEYESFVKRYAKYLLIIQFVFKKNFIYDQDQIILLVEKYENKNP